MRRLGLILMACCVACYGCGGESYSDKAKRQEQERREQAEQKQQFLTALARQWNATTCDAKTFREAPTLLLQELFESGPIAIEARLEDLAKTKDGHLAIFSTTALYDGTMQLVLNIDNKAAKIIDESKNSRWRPSSYRIVFRSKRIRFGLEPVAYERQVGEEVYGEIVLSRMRIVYGDLIACERF